MLSYPAVTRQFILSPFFFISWLSTKSCTPHACESNESRKQNIVKGNVNYGVKTLDSGGIKWPGTMNSAELGEGSLWAGVVLEQNTQIETRDNVRDVLFGLCMSV